MSVPVSRNWKKCLFRLLLGRFFGCFIDNQIQYLNSSLQPLNILLSFYDVTRNPRIFFILKLFSPCSHSVANFCRFCLYCLLNQFTLGHPTAIMFVLVTHLKYLTGCHSPPLQPIFHAIFTVVFFLMHIFNYGFSGLKSVKFLKFLQ